MGKKTRGGDAAGSQPRFSATSLLGTELPSVLETPLRPLSSSRGEEKRCKEKVSQLWPGWRDLGVKSLVAWSLTCDSLHRKGIWEQGEMGRYHPELGGSSSRCGTL